MIKEIFLFFSLVFMHGLVFANLDIEDKVLTRNIDVTGDGKEETIVLELHGQDWKDPFSWTLLIKDGDKTILKHKSNDAWLDANFNDEGYVLGCSGYLDCKKKYYTEDILENLVVMTNLAANKHACDQNNLGSIHVVARKDLLEKHSLTEGQAEEIVEKLINRLKTGKMPMLYIPVSAVESQFPIMYVSEVEGFVKVYEW